MSPFHALLRLTGVCFAGCVVWAGSYNMMGIVNYGSEWLPDGTRQSVLRFQSDKYDIYFGGANINLYRPDAIWTCYQDMMAVYPRDTYDLKAKAAERFFSYEDMFLHSKVNYQVQDRYIWREMDRFDAFESGTVNGVLLQNSAGYTDRTVAAYDNNPGDVQIEDKLLLGYGEPFDEINFLLSVKASSIRAVWEFWNGSAWEKIPILTDGTDQLKKSGRIQFIPPATWKTKSENGSVQKWWVRLTVSGSGARPVASRIYGNDWTGTSSANFNARGWDPNGFVMNAGLGPLEYNPFPPAGASAKFRYQSRVLGLWTNNLMFGNLSNVQRGQFTWATYLTVKSQESMTAGKFNGVMLDDGNSQPDVLAPAAFQQSLDMNGSFPALQTSTYGEVVRQIKQNNSAAKVCINSTTWAQVRQGDCNLVEFMAFAHRAAGISHAVVGDSQAGGSTSFDQYLPVNNPANVRGVITTFDNMGDSFLTADGQWTPWDRGNRGPIAALSAYYIFANTNTRFAYNTNGFVYLDTDEVSWYAGQTNTSSAVNRDATPDTTKYISGNFSGIPSSYTQGQKGAVAIGSYGEHLRVWKVSSTQLATTDSIHHSYAAGTIIRWTANAHLSTDPIPPLEKIHKWNNWFPAVAVDIGVPDPNGYKQGNRDLTWRLASASGTGSRGDIWRRDFTNAVVLHRPGDWDATVLEMNLLPIPLALGRTYYPLQADGKTGAGTTLVFLRRGEGAILLKSPR